MKLNKENITEEMEKLILIVYGLLQNFNERFDTKEKFMEKGWIMLPVTILLIQNVYGGLNEEITKQMNKEKVSVNIESDNKLAS